MSTEIDARSSDGGRAGDSVGYYCIYSRPSRTVLFLREFVRTLSAAHWSLAQENLFLGRVWGYSARLLLCQKKRCSGGGENHLQMRFSPKFGLRGHKIEQSSPFNLPKPSFCLYKSNSVFWSRIACIRLAAAAAAMGAPLLPEARERVQLELQCGTPYKTIATLFCISER